MNISYFIYLLINVWTSGLFPPLGYYAKCCYEHLCTSSAWMYVFISLECMYLGNETVKLPYVVILFNSLRNCQTVFQSGCSILLIYSWLQSMKLQISPYPQPKLVIVCLFFITVMLVGVKWYLPAVLRYIFFMTNDVEHLFMYSLVQREFFIFVTYRF